MKILVVDDDILIRTLVSNKLILKGDEVFAADNGASALGIIQNQKLDIIISDIMMPGLNGLSLLSVLRTFYFHKIPVIFISSLDKKDLISKSIELGANNFMVKPIQFEKLYQMINSCVNNSIENK